MEYEIEMNFCRRCGTALTEKGSFVYVCEQGHNIFYNDGVSGIVALFDKQGRVLMVERAVEAKGMWDLPGGFCQPTESLEEGAKREMLEEVGLAPSDYSDLEYLGSGIATYHYGSEVVPTLDVIFRAYLKDGVTPKAGSDAAKVFFVDLADLDLDKIYSAAGRNVLASLQKSS